MTDIALMNGIVKSSMDILATHPRFTRTLVGAFTGALYALALAYCLNDRRQISAAKTTSVTLQSKRKFNRKFYRAAAAGGALVGAAVFGHP